jgi:cytochrome c biogenesis protein ResB
MAGYLLTLTGFAVAIGSEPGSKWYWTGNAILFVGLFTCLIQVAWRIWHSHRTNQAEARELADLRSRNIVAHWALQRRSK